MALPPAVALVVYLLTLSSVKNALECLQCFNTVDS